MKNMLYGINFAPELIGIGKYTGEMAAWLADKGHDVRVVTARLLTLPGLLTLATVAAPTAPSSGRVQR